MGCLAAILTSYFEGLILPYALATRVSWIVTETIIGQLFLARGKPERHACAQMASLTNRLAGPTSWWVFLVLDLPNHTIPPSPYSTPSTAAPAY